MAEKDHIQGSHAGDVSADGCEVRGVAWRPRVKWKVSS